MQGKVGGKGQNNRNKSKTLNMIKKLFSCSSAGEAEGRKKGEMWGEEKGEGEGEETPYHANICGSATFIEHEYSKTGVITSFYTSLTNKLFTTQSHTKLWTKLSDRNKFQTLEHKRIFVFLRINFLSSSRKSHLQEAGISVNSSF